MKYHRRLDDEGSVHLSAVTEVPARLDQMDRELRRTVEARVLEGLRQECGLFVPAALVTVEHLVVAPRVVWRKGRRVREGGARPFIEWSLAVPRPWLLPSSSPAAQTWRLRLTDPLGYLAGEEPPTPTDPEDETHGP